MKKTVVSFLLLLGICMNFTACGSKPSVESNADKPQDTGSEVTSAAAETDKELTVEELLGFSSENNGGKTFNILSTVHAAYEYVAEEQTGDLVEDAIYERNLAVEELLGIKFNMITAPGHWVDRASFNNLITNSVMAGDGAYDLISGTTVCVIPIASEGVFINVNEMPGIDLTKPWWVQGMSDDLSINGILYGFIGDASLSLYKDLSVIYFNKQMIDDYSLQSPYELIGEDKWTLDKMFEIASVAGADLNGDGAWKSTDDRFDFIFHNVPMRTFQTSTEFTVIDYDDDNTPFISPLSDSDISLYDKMYTFLMLDNVWGVDVSDHNEIASIFADNRSMLMCGFIYYTEYLRDMENDYGIVPLPKRDENQDNYHTQIGTSTSMFFIPITTNSEELTSKVCEALSYYSYANVVPVYYETALKEKYARDTEVKEMLDIIRDTAMLDFTFAYSTMFTSSLATNMVLCASKNPRENIVSHFESKFSAMQSTLESIIDTYSK